MRFTTKQNKWSCSLEPTCILCFPRLLKHRDSFMGIFGGFIRVNQPSPFVFREIPKRVRVQEDA